MQPYRERMNDLWRDAGQSGNFPAPTALPPMEIYPRELEELASCIGSITNQNLRCITIAFQRDGRTWLGTYIQLARVGDALEDKPALTMLTAPIHLAGLSSRRYRKVLIEQLGQIATGQKTSFRRVGSTCYRVAKWMDAGLVAEIKPVC